MKFFDYEKVSDDEWLIFAVTWFMALVSTPFIGIGALVSGFLIAIWYHHLVIDDEPGLSFYRLALFGILGGLLGWLLSVFLIFVS